MSYWIMMGGVILVYHIISSYRHENYMIRGWYWSRAPWCTRCWIERFLKRTTFHGEEP